MKKNYHFIGCYLIAICIINATLWMPTPASAQGKTYTENEKMDLAVKKFVQALSYMDKSYIDTIDYDKMVEGAINSMLGELDPHSIYIPQGSYEKVREPLQGSFIGVGVQFHIFEDTILVINVLKGGPAYKKGIKAGDKILKINEQNVAGVGITPNEVTKELRGDNNKLVKIQTLNRKAKTKDHTISLERVALNSVDIAYMPTPHTGYIRLNRFAASTMQEFKKAMKSFESKGTFDNLILDLRGNGGGYLSVAFDLANQFLERGQLVVYTEGLNYKRKEYKANGQGVFKQGKLVVLIDEGAASASEIVAGAIQDWDRGLIIGRRSFGKGLVQKPFSFNDGSVMRLTIANYRTPCGRSIQKSYAQGREAYYKDIPNRYKRGEMLSKGNIDLPDSLLYYTKNEERMVYGGGGIMPDLFIPIDTVTQTAFFLKVANVKNNYLRDFLLGYLEVNREKLLKTYKTLADYEANFEVDQDMIEDFYVYLIENNIEIKEAVWDKSKKPLKQLITVSLGAYLWDNAAYYRLKNKTDAAVLKGLEVLESPQPIAYYFYEEAKEKELREADNPYASEILKLKPNKSFNTKGITEEDQQKEDTNQDQPIQKRLLYEKQKAQEAEIEKVEKDKTNIEDQDLPIDTPLKKSLLNDEDSPTEKATQEREKLEQKSVKTKPRKKKRNRFFRNNKNIESNND